MASGGGQGVEAKREEKKKRGMKSIFGMNGLFWGESARRRGRKWDRKKRGGEGDGKQEECYTISN